MLAHILKITNGARRGLQIGAGFRTYKLRREGLQIGQLKGFQIGAKRLQIGAKGFQIGAREITNRQIFQIGVGTANRCRTRVTLAVIFDEFEIVYIFLLLFPFHYHSQLLKGQL